MSGSIAKAGAAYEAVLVDKVTAKADQIVAAVNRLEAAFKGVDAPAASFNASMSGISKSMSAATRQLTNRSDGFRAFGREVTNAAQTVATAGQSIGQSLIHIGNQIRNVGITATAAGVSIGAFLFKAAQQFSTASGMLAAFNATFGKTADDMNRWVEIFAQRTGRSMTDVRASLLGFQGVFSQLKGSEEQINGLSKAVLQMALDFGAARELTDSEATSKMLKALSGSPETLAEFGFNVRDAAIAEQELAQQMGLTAGKMNEQEKILLRFLMISQRMKDLGWMGQLKSESEQLPNQLARLSSAFKELMEAIGKLVAPTIIKGVQMLTDVIKQLMEYAPQIESVLKGVAAVLIPLGGALMFVGQFMSSMGPPIIAATTAFGALAFVGQMVAKFLIALGPILGPLAMGFLTVTAALGALYAYFFVTEFPVMKSLNTLKEAFSNIGEVVDGAMIALKGAVAEQNWSDVWQIIKYSGIVVFYELGKAITTIIKDALIAGWEGFQNFISGPFERFWPEGLTGIKGGGGKGKDGGNGLSMVENAQFELAKLIGKYKAMAKKAEDAAKRKEEGSDFFTGKKRSWDDYVEKANEEAEDMSKALGNLRSVVTSSAVVAGAAGDFGPSTESNLEKETAKQTDIQQKLLEQAGKINETLSKVEPALFGA